MSGLPQGWAEVLLTDISAKEKFSIVDGPFGSDLKISDYTPDGTVPVLTTKNLTDYYDSSSVRFISQVKFDSVKRSKVEGGDILIAKIGSIGKCCIYPMDAPVAIIPANLCKIKVNKEAILNRYLYLQIKSYEFQNKLKDITLATAQPAFSVQRLKTLSINLAPLNEQCRIVAKLEELLASVDASQQRLTKIPVILKRFRQAVLAAACSGRLTADWREENGFGEGEDLPEGWRSTSFQSVANEITVGFVGPMAKEYIETGVPFLRSLNVRPFRFDPTNLKFISREFHERIKKSRLTPGDVAIVRSGNSGVACVVPDELSEANCSDLVILRPGLELLPLYACLFLNSNIGQAHVESVKVGIAQGHFNVGSMKTTIVPLPPLPEQQEIVRRVESFFTLADQLETRYRTAKTHVDKLTQSILAKAFRGELVPQDPNDEPAVVLLERIRAERAKTTPARTRRC